MRTYFLFVTGQTVRSMHEQLKTMLALPAYYGMNLDALNDVMGERKEKIRLCVEQAQDAPTDMQNLIEGLEKVMRDTGNGFLRF